MLQGADIRVGLLLYRGVYGQAVTVQFKQMLHGRLCMRGWVGMGEGQQTWHC